MGAGLPLPDPQLDLVFERRVEAPPEALWSAWTVPARLLPWFTPAPWRTVDCEIDLRPGGIFRTTMLSPEAKVFANAGCYLDVVPNERLVWTNALGPGFRPRNLASDESCDGFAFTVVLTLEAEARATHYRARVLHGSEEGRRKHEAMGFHEGWGLALDQLLAMLRRESA